MIAPSVRLSIQVAAQFMQRGIEMGGGQRRAQAVQPGKAGFERLQQGLRPIGGLLRHCGIEGEGRQTGHGAAFFP